MARLLLVFFCGLAFAQEDPVLEKRVRDLSSELRCLVCQNQTHGDFVLYRPPLKASTVLLWVGPFILLAFGLFLLFLRIKRKVPPTPELSDEDRARAAKLLE